MDFVFRSKQARTQAIKHWLYVSEMKHGLVSLLGPEGYMDHFGVALLVL